MECTQDQITRPKAYSVQYNPDNRPVPSSVLTSDKEELLCKWIVSL